MLLGVFVRWTPVLCLTSHHLLAAESASTGLVSSPLPVHPQMAVPIAALALEQESRVHQVDPKWLPEMRYGWPVWQWLGSSQPEAGPVMAG